jgi:hypothetical protein
MSASIRRKTRGTKTVVSSADREVLIARARLPIASLCDARGSARQRAARDAGP